MAPKKEEPHDAGRTSEIFAEDDAKLLLLHPSVMWQFTQLTHALRQTTVLLPSGNQAFLRPFETVRSAVRQLELYKEGRTKAQPWESGHQYGLAADYVPWNEAEGWHWPSADHECWNLLRREVGKVGLWNGLAWDRPHVEHQKRLKAVRKAYAAG